ncbi:uncharacterized protein E0L32_009496 [Thyridium curvatum]|uniref:Uncharacterized protein n=1 Tax=Thyridium curvatum TaxID=1093900 RepID=A0A507AS05_9PEZI|nr:uncharacterized protein E0L32_009496 [Thyridium curvatum]TPX09304.1 hypothetical protein E0L32_009496 [Thyridium curvatum]
MKASSLWLVLLAQVVASSAAQYPRDRHNAQPPSTGRDVAQGGEPPEFSRQPGADLVDAAMTELRKIHNPAHEKKHRRNGIFGLVVRYAWKVLPSLTISAPPQQDATHREISGPLLEAVKLLETSAQSNNSDALFLLGQMNFYGNYSHPRNFERAFDYYNRLADWNGNSSAMHMLGLFYSTGIGGAVKPDQAKALLYYTFAAIRGETRAEMTVAFRHHSGIGTPKNCEAAAKYYKRVADKAIAWHRSGPPGGRAWSHETYRIADEAGGVYGEGASASSSGINAIRAHPGSESYASIEDVIEFFDLMSQKGDFKASFNLGRLYYEGQRGLEPDLNLARRYFVMVVTKYWKKDGRVVENFKPGLDKTAARAAGYIGRMYMRGDGVDQNFERAKTWFDRGIAHGDAQSQYCMGLLLMHGYGGFKSMSRAAELFKAAADQDFGPAQVELGALYLDQGTPDDVRIANDYFEGAARYGNVEAQYYLAEMIHHGVGRDKACGQAVAFYKNVAEKAEPLVSSWVEANIAYAEGDYELALLDYLAAAEQGYEKAQTNVGFILDPQKSSVSLSSWLFQQKPKSGLLQNPSLGLIHWTRSSRQGNIDSLVKMGDYYLSGIGAEPDVDKAVQCYTGASEYHQSAQALYNLGWMHENGVGLNQDYHLAKRYYDAALATNEEAYLPVTLSLLKLRARSAWNTFTHGRINSIQDEPAVKKDWSFSEWIANFLSDENLYWDDDFDDYDSSMPGGDGGAMPEDIDDGVMESLVIVGLAAALAFLVYYRQQRQQAHQRQEEEARRRQQGDQGGQVVGGGGAPAPQQPDRGMFPRPGDPEFANWVAGGIGH